MIMSTINVSARSSIATSNYYFKTEKVTTGTGYGDSAYGNVGSSDSDAASSVRDKRRMLLVCKNGNNSVGSNIISDSVVDAAKKYGDFLHSQRTKSNETSNNLQKLKYHFKNLSSKIVSSKSSFSARQVVNQAKREIQSLKRAKQSGKYDDEEIEAAITHAKAMERIARKKVKHLEEEEMQRAGKNPCMGSEIQEEDKDKNDNEIRDIENPEENIGSTEKLDSLENLDYSANMVNSDSIMNSENIVNSDSIEKLLNEFAEEFTDEMKDLLEELGLEDLTKDMVGGTTDIDPEDIKALKIKHRNAEMKEIVKADCEYLKTTFEHLENIAENSAAVSSGVDSTGTYGGSVIDVSV